jgi:hypothetical protein
MFSARRTSRACLSLRGPFENVTFTGPARYENAIFEATATFDS